MVSWYRFFQVLLFRFETDLNIKGSHKEYFCSDLLGSTVYLPTTVGEKILSGYWQISEPLKQLHSLSPLFPHILFTNSVTIFSLRIYISSFTFEVHCCLTIYNFNFLNDFAFLWASLAENPFQVWLYTWEFILRLGNTLLHFKFTSRIHTTEKKPQN